jgi:hypothetical protein
MVDTKTVQAKAREAMYASLGAGQVLVEKAKGSAEWIRSYGTPAGFREYWAKRGTRVTKAYAELAERGRKLSGGIGRSAPVKRAAVQTKTARTHVKAATTSVRKAVGESALAGKSVAKKVS